MKKVADKFPIHLSDAAKSSHRMNTDCNSDSTIFQALTKKHLVQVMLERTI